MDYAIEPSFMENLLQRIEVANVGFNQCEICIRNMLLDVRSLEPRIVEVVEVVDDGDSPITFGHQAIDEVRTDKACSAGDENILHFRKGVSTGSGSDRVTIIQSISISFRSSNKNCKSVFWCAT